MFLIFASSVWVKSTVYLGMNVFLLLIEQYSDTQFYESENRYYRELIIGLTSQP